MNNRIKKYLDSMDGLTPSDTNDLKKPPKLTEGEWVTVHVAYDDDGAVTGVHCVRGKHSVSEIIIRRAEEGIYDTVEGFTVRLETEDSDHG